MAGIIDGDGDYSRMTPNNVHRLECYSVEGLLLVPTVLQLVVKQIQDDRQEPVDFERTLKAVVQASRNSLEEAVLLLARQSIEGELRAQALEANEVLGAGPIVRFAQPRSAAIRQRLDHILDSEDLDAIAREIPAKKTGGHQAAARSLSITMRTLVDTATKLIRGDDDLREDLLSKFGLDGITELP